jgi:photosystem II stability/assembly factor-like uncharacterized protein
MRKTYILLYVLIIAVLMTSVWQVEAQSKKGKSLPQRARAAKKTTKNKKIISEPKEEFEEEELEGIDLAKERAKHFFRQRAFPFDHIPVEKRLVAIEQTKVNNIKALVNTNVTEPLKFIGPSPITNGQTLGDGSSFTGTRQNISGRIASVAVDPKDPNTVYVGGAQGGLWRSTNSGQSWTSITDNAPSQSIGAIAIDPTNSNIIYAGTGEGNFSGDCFFGMGILKTTDGGNTWQTLAAQLFVGRAVNDIVIDPTNPNTLYVGIGSAFAGIATVTNPTVGINGVYKSTDGGQTFTPSLRVTTASQFGSTVFDVKMDPNNPSILYAAINGQGIFKTTDAGANWTKLSGGLPTTGFSRIDVGISKNNSNVLYASIADARTDELLNIYKSTDGGSTWTIVPKPPANVFGNICQCSYDNYIAVDPTNENTVYFGAVSLYRSDDGGQNWNPIGINVHPDHHGFAFTPSNPSRIFIANDGGVWMSQDKGNTMVNVNNNLSMTQFQSVSIHPTDPNITIGGTQDNGTNLFNGSTTWMHVFDGDAGFTRIDQLNPNTMYNTRFNLAGVVIGLNRSDSAGAFNTWFPIRNGINQADDVLFYAPFEVDPNKADTVYFGTFRLYRTTNKGTQWQPISNRLTKSNGQVISTIGVSKGNSVIYTGATDGSVFVSKDNGSSFQNVTDNLPARYVSDISIDPSNSNNVYVSLSGFQSGHVFRSTTGGGSWQDISGNLPDIPANALNINPSNINNIFVGTDLGVFETMDGGKNWSLVPGMPMVSVFDMDLNAKFGILRVATHGRGMYETKLTIPQAPTVSINSANFTKPNLNIAGAGFGTNGAQVSVNNKNISSFITSQTDTAIVLKGNKKKLNLVKGANQLTVTNSGGNSASFTFNF